MVTSRVVFVCSRGAGRAPLAAALWRSTGGEARPAGIHPAAAIYQHVAAVLAEIGIRPDEDRPRGLSVDDLEWADVVVAMGCADELAVSEMQVIEWSLPEVDWEQIDDVRRQRDAIAASVRSLCRK